MQNQQQLASKSLPTHGSYKTNCHSYSGKYLAYLSTNTNQSHIRILQFSQNTTIVTQQIIKTREQPILFIKICQNNQTLYLMIGYLTKIVLCKIAGTIYQIICQNKLGLDRNIVDYMMGYISCDVWYKNQKEIYFIVSTRNCRLYFVNILSQVRDQKMEFIVNKYDTIDRVVSLVVVKDKIYIGDEKGLIHRINLMKVQLEETFDTKSNLPILNLKAVQKQETAIGVTCQGQIILFKNDKSIFKSISIHHSIISRLHVQKNDIYTFGQDGILNHFRLQKEQIKVIESKGIKKMPGMMFSILGCGYYTLYQQNPIYKLV